MVASTLLSLDLRLLRRSHPRRERVVVGHPLRHLDSTLSPVPLQQLVSLRLVERALVHQFHHPLGWLVLVPADLGAVVEEIVWVAGGALLGPNGRLVCSSSPRRLCSRTRASLALSLLITNSGNLS